MSTLRSEIEAAALSFADSLFQILRKHSIDDIASAAEGPAPTASRRRAPPARPLPKPKAEAPAPARAKRGSAGRRPRGGETDVAAVAARVVDFVTRNGESGKKAILQGTGVQADVLQKALTHARGHGALALRGEKRNARYVATGKSLS